MGGVDQWCLPVSGDAGEVVEAKTDLQGESVVTEGEQLYS